MPRPPSTSDCVGVPATRGQVCDAQESTAAVAAQLSGVASSLAGLAGLVKMVSAFEVVIADVAVAVEPLSVNVAAVSANVEAAIADVAVAAEPLYTRMATVSAKVERGFSGCPAVQKKMQAMLGLGRMLRLRRSRVPIACRPRIARAPRRRPVAKRSRARSPGRQADDSHLAAPGDELGASPCRGPPGASSRYRLAPCKDARPPVKPGAIEQTQRRHHDI
jgi:hypothetical protein